MTGELNCPDTHPSDLSVTPAELDLPVSHQSFQLPCKLSIRPGLLWLTARIHQPAVTAHELKNAAGLMKIDPGRLLFSQCLTEVTSKLARAVV